MGIHKFTGWENAPEGATHFCVGDCANPWLKRTDDGDYFYNRGYGWMRYGKQPSHHFVDAIERPAKKENQAVVVNVAQEQRKFVKGDKVRVVCNEPVGGWGPFVKKGDVGVVNHVLGDFHPGDMLTVDFPKHYGWYARLHELELVVDEPEAVPHKKVYTLADLKGTGVDAQLVACAVDARTLRKLRDRVVYNLNNMERFWAGGDELERLANINDAFSWRHSPEGGWLWTQVLRGRVVKFEDIPARPRGWKVKVEQAAPAQPRADVPAPAAPVVEKKVEAPVEKQPVKKVGWW